MKLQKKNRREENPKQRTGKQEELLIVCVSWQEASTRSEIDFTDYMAAIQKPRRDSSMRR